MKSKYRWKSFMMNHSQLHQDGFILKFHEVPYRTKFRRTKVPKIWIRAENFVRRKILSAENFVRRNILSAEFLSSSWHNMIRVFMALSKMRHWKWAIQRKMYFFVFVFLCMQSLHHYITQLTSLSSLKMPESSFLGLARVLNNLAPSVCQSVSL